LLLQECLEVGDLGERGFLVLEGAFLGPALGVRGLALGFRGLACCLLARACPSSMRWMARMFRLCFRVRVG
jgi:hypothetical protein